MPSGTGAPASGEGEPEFVRSLTETERLAVSTVEGILTRLREALSRAVVRKLIAVNPAAYVRVSLADKKTDKRENERAKPWTVDEVQLFIKGIEDDRLYAPLLMSLMGLRPAEVCGQRWTDLDLRLGTLEMTNTRTMTSRCLRRMPRPRPVNGYCRCRRRRWTL